MKKKKTGIESFYVARKKKHMWENSWSHESQTQSRGASTSITTTERKLASNWAAYCVCIFCGIETSVLKAFCLTDNLFLLNHSSNLPAKHTAKKFMYFFETCHFVKQQKLLIVFWKSLGRESNYTGYHNSIC